MSMMEDCATGMSVWHGCNNESEVVATLMEVLKQRIGEEPFQMWFAQGVSFSLEPSVASQTLADETTESASASSSLTDGALTVRVRGQFALERVRDNFLAELRGSAMQVVGKPLEIRFVLDSPPAKQAPLPLDDSQAGLHQHLRSTLRNGRVQNENDRVERNL